MKPIKKTVERTIDYILDVNKTGDLCHNLLNERLMRTIDEVISVVNSLDELLKQLGKLNIKY